MKFLANENIPYPSLDFLLSLGIDLKSIARTYSGISDEEVIKLASKEDRTIITMDSDYGELIYKLGFKPKAGVVYFRLKKFRPTEIGEILFELISKKIIFENKLIVVDENSIRERNY